VYLTIQTAWEA